MKRKFFAGCETFHKTLPEAIAGDQIGLLLKGVKKDDIRRGMVVGAPGTLSMHDHVMAQFYLLKKEEGGDATPLVDYNVSHIYSKTWDVHCTINLPNLEEREMIMPGEDGE